MRFKIVKYPNIIALLGLIIFSGVANCETEKVIVAASIPPLAEFAEKIGGDRIQAHVMIPPGANPHVYEPTPSQLKILGKARLYVAVGSGIEFEIAWLEKLKGVSKNILFVNSSEGIELIKAFHQHANHHRSGESSQDPHVWLSPVNAIVMVENISKALSQVDPEYQTQYQLRGRQYQEELRALDSEIRNRLTKLKQRTFFVYHPAWSYFAKEYGLSEVAIEFDGKEPSAQQLIRTAHSAKEQRAKTVFVSPQFSQKSAEMIAAEIDARVRQVNELSKDYVKNLQSFSEQLIQAEQS